VVLFNPSEQISALCNLKDNTATSFPIYHTGLSSPFHMTFNTASLITFKPTILLYYILFVIKFYVTLVAVLLDMDAYNVRNL